MTQGSLNSNMDKKIEISRLALVASNWLGFFFLLASLSCAGMPSVMKRHDSLFDRFSRKWESSEQFPVTIGTQEETKAGLQALRYSTKDYNSLMNSKMWIIVDSLKKDLLKQREKIEKLEEQINEKKNSPRPRLREREIWSEQEARPLGANEKGWIFRPNALTTQELHARRSRYETRLSDAKKKFQHKDYGKSYMEFSELEQEFSDNLTQGEPIYWQARCLLRLDEPALAMRSLLKFSTQFSHSPLVTKAKLYQAEAELQLGRRDTAIRHLHEIIHEGRSAEITQVAKQKLLKLTNNL